MPASQPPEILPDDSPITYQFRTPTPPEPPVILADDSQTTYVMRPPRAEVVDAPQSVLDTLTSLFTGPTQARQQPVAASVTVPAASYAQFPSAPSGPSFVQPTPSPAPTASVLDTITSFFTAPIDAITGGGPTPARPRPVSAYATVPSASYAQFPSAPVKSPSAPSTPSSSTDWAKLITGAATGFATSAPAVAQTIQAIRGGYQPPQPLPRKVVEDHTALYAAIAAGTVGLAVLTFVLLRKK